MREAPPTRQRGTLRRVWGMTVGHRGGLLGVTLLTMLGAPLALLLPVPVKIAVDSVIGEDPIPGALDALLPDSWETSGALLMTVVVLQIAIVAATQLQELLTYLLQTKVGETLTLQFRRRLFAHVQKLSFAYHDRIGTHDTVYRIQYDAPSVQELTVYGVVPLASAVVTLIAMVVVILRIDQGMAVVALAVTPLLFAVSRGYKTRMRPFYRRAREFESDAMGVVQESLGAVRVVKAFGREDAEHERFTDRSSLGVRAKIRLALAEGLLGLALNLLTGIATALVLYIGVRQVTSGNLSLGDLLLVMAYLGSLYGPLNQVNSTIGTLQNAMTGAQRAFEVLDETPDVVDAPHAIPMARARGDVDLIRVTFTYPDEPDPVLRDVHLSIPAGARVGIVGRTGAGKSTLISLLMRFYDPDRGRITLDGIDIANIQLADLRRQFALVLQEPVLFAATIEENIAYGRLGASREEIVQASRAANAHDFITALPDGYDTMVGERGMRLSGGERQRISLARAFLKDAPLLILDEPTSAVDTHTEAGIMAALEQLMAGRTTFMIAHRLSTLDSCDAILQVTDGRVAVQQTRLDRPVVFGPDGRRQSPSAGEESRGGPG